MGARRGNPIAGGRRRRVVRLCSPAAARSHDLVLSTTTTHHDLVRSSCFALAHSAFQRTQRHQLLKLASSMVASGSPSSRSETRSENRRCSRPICFEGCPACFQLDGQSSLSQSATVHNSTQQPASWGNSKLVVRLDHGLPSVSGRVIYRASDIPICASLFCQLRTIGTCHARVANRFLLTVM